MKPVNIPITRDHAIKQAKFYRDRIILRLKVANDPKMPFGERYLAHMQCEEYEEAARRFDKYAEQERAK